MRVQFNTGRLYVPEGQIIVAEYRDGAIHFNDTARMIAGAIPAARAPDSPRDLARMTMAGYDHGLYRDGSMADAPRPDFNSPLLTF